MNRILLTFYTLCFIALPVYASAPHFGKVIQSNSPAVVNIVTEKAHKQEMVPEHVLNQLRGTPLMNVLKELYGNKLEEKLSGETRGIGSGSIISSNGFIITNYHVVKDAIKIQVRLNDHREFDATLMGFDVGTDLALLKIDANELPTVILAEQDATKVGDWVVAIGSPFGFTNTVTAGIISAKGRSLMSERYVPFIQTDVAINPGNSGGPLFNLNGEMVGINSQIMTETGGYAGISFAIPVHVVKTVVNQIQSKGSVSRGWMGLAFQDVTYELARSFDMESVRGALISKVVPGSPADRAGLKIGDVITAFNNQEVIYATDLPPIVGVLPVHSKVPVVVLRDQETKKLEMILGDSSERLRVRQIQFQPSSGPGSIHEQLIRVRALDHNEQRAIASVQGVMVEKVPNRVWRDAGVREGDIILAVGQSFVNSRDAFYDELQNHSGQSVALLITRIGEVQRFIAVKVK